MKRDWQTKSFEECIEKVTYTNKIQRKYFLDDGPYPIVSQENGLINGYWSDKEHLFKVNTPVIIFGDHTCVLKYVDFDFVLGADGVKILQPKEFIHPKFFFYFLQMSNISSVGYARHYKLLKDLRVNFPELLEQQRIVNILDEAIEDIAKARANTEKNLQNARALFESHLQSIFSQRGEGWLDKKLSEVCVLVNGRAYSKEELLEQGKYPVLRVGNFFTNNHWYYSDLELEPDKYCNDGDLLYAWSASFGPRIWRGGKVIYHYHIWKVLPNASLIEKSFLMYLLEWDVEQIKKAHGTGTTMMHISKASMESRVVPIPPITNQPSIISQLDSLKEETQNLETIYLQKLNALDELRSSLLHQAFIGQI